MSATLPPPVAAPPKMPRAPASIAVRLAATAIILGVYFILHAQIVQTMSQVMDAMFARVIAVTLLGIALVSTWWQVFKGDVRFYAPILITYILAVGDATYGILESHPSSWLSWLTGGQVTTYSPTFVAIIVSAVLEIALSQFTKGKWPHLASAYISGISVGILVKSPALWPFIMCAAISITSKYVLRVNGRHLWNPSNFGITLLLWLGGDQMASLSVQAGNEIYPVILIWVLGSLILYRLGRMHIPLTFVACFVPLALFRAYVTDPGDPKWLAQLAPMTWPMFQLYIFFMITDPATTTKKKWSQCLVVVLVAIMETFLRLVFRDVHALYHALFIVGPSANLIEILLTRKAKPKPLAA